MSQPCSVAHELEPHRLADELRHDGRRLGGVVLEVAAVAARALEELDPHLVGGIPSSPAIVVRVP